MQLCGGGAFNISVVRSFIDLYDMVNDMKLTTRLKKNVPARFRENSAIVLGTVVSNGKPQIQSLRTAETALPMFTQLVANDFGSHRKIRSRRTQLKKQFQYAQTSDSRSRRHFDHRGRRRLRPLPRLQRQNEEQGVHRLRRGQQILEAMRRAKGNANE